MNINPFDNRSYYYDNDRLKQYKFSYLLDESFFEGNIYKTRLSSFSSSGVNNLPMWAHYSNNHKGYCVSYLTDFKSNPELSPSLFPVQYWEGRVNVTQYFHKGFRLGREN
jgi:hypothetical protein